MKVNLGKISDVKQFVCVMNSIPVDASLHSGRYIIDAKSIMGIFSLDLSSPTEIVFHGKISDEDFEKIKPFIVE